MEELSQHASSANIPRLHAQNIPGYMQFYLAKLQCRIMQLVFFPCTCHCLKKANRLKGSYEMYVTNLRALCCYLSAGSNRDCKYVFPNVSMKFRRPESAHRRFTATDTINSV